ncbi:MAG: sialate O-acetylesterase [Chitinophagaceae bacterium]|nr:MAG: sialate O-acetylesterase [Chitinophagaceae bacterium]
MNASGKIKLPSIIGNDMVLQQLSNVPLWGESNSNTIVKVTTSWNHKTYRTRSDATGHWKIRISTPEAGGPYKITFDDGSVLTLKDILIGEVWVCSGQSNIEISLEGYGNTPILHANDILMKADNPDLRLFHVQRAVSNSPLADCTGAWKISTSESASTFSAVGFQFAQMLQHILKVPVGIIESAWGGTPIEAWMDKKSLQSFPYIHTPVPNDSTKPDRLRPTCLFNGMIAPIAGYGIKGFLWYQGNGNVTHPGHVYDYDKLMVAMVNEWRNLWKLDTLPFYYVQIAPWKYGKYRDSVPYLWAAQQRAQSEIPHSGMVVTVDIGSQYTVHPPDKTTVSKRLLYWALGDAYQRKGIAFASPVYKNMDIKGNVITVTFTNTPHGFTSWDKRISGFEIAGADKIFYPANAKIYRNSIEVESDKVPDPVAVRYAFKDWVVGDLYNTEGLPVAPFRTDNW